MRVLHVAEPAEGGVARYVGLLAAHQRGLGWEVYVAAPPRGRHPHQIPWEAGPRPGPAVPGEVARLARIVRDVRPDVVHLHSSKAGLAGRLVLRGRLPTVFQPHAWSFLAVTGQVRAATLGWERYAARWASRILCVSEFERRAGEEAGVRGAYDVVPNGVDLARFPPGGTAERKAARADLGLPDGPLAVCVGRLHRQKGQHLLLDAWPRVRVAVPGARLALVGDGPDRAALAGRGAWLPGPARDVVPWLHAADVVVLPSRWEGLSLALLEAMACARSVVATEVSAEVVRDDAGATVPYGDLAALSGALCERLRDPALATREGLAGRARVEAGHDQAVTLARVAALTEAVAR